MGKISIVSLMDSGTAKRVQDFVRSMHEVTLTELDPERGRWVVHGTGTVWFNHSTNTLCPDALKTMGRSEVVIFMGDDPCIFSVISYVRISGSSDRVIPFVVISADGKILSKATHHDASNITGMSLDALQDDGARENLLVIMDAVQQPRQQP